MSRLGGVEGDVKGDFGGLLMAHGLKMRKMWGGEENIFM